MKAAARRELEEALGMDGLPDDMEGIDKAIGRFKAAKDTTWAHAERVNTAKMNLVWACNEMKAHGIED